MIHFYLKLMIAYSLMPSRDHHLNAELDWMNPSALSVLCSFIPATASLLLALRLAVRQSDSALSTGTVELYSGLLSVFNPPFIFLYP